MTILTNDLVLNALAVVPIADLTAGDIAGEIHLKGVTGRTLIPFLQSLEAQGRIVRFKYRKQYFYRLSDPEAERVLKEYEKLRR